MIRCRIAGLFLVMALLILSAGSATAGFDEGVAAYKRGDYAAALREFMPLALAGDSSAQYNLGVIYRLGEGVPQNDAEAMRWYRLAAAQGAANAQNDLGVMYADGPWRAPGLRRGGALVPAGRRPGQRASAEQPRRDVWQW
jgi:TPR repeat protein